MNRILPSLFAASLSLIPPAWADEVPETEAAQPTPAAIELVAHGDRETLRQLKAAALTAIATLQLRQEVDVSNAAVSATTDAAPATQHAVGKLSESDAALVALQKRALAAGQSADSSSDDRPAADALKLAAAYRAAGLPDQAEAICEQLAARHVDKTALAIERLRLAQFRYDAGELDRADALLALSRADIPEQLAIDWRFTKAQSLLARDQLAEAVALLKQPNADYVEALRYMSEPTETVRAATYRRFNLAAALIAHGDQQRGRSWLDRVGRIGGRDKQLLALRDQANLMLGWQFLEDKQGRTAIGVLGRVSSEGPFSNSALLGIGWAQLVPAGEKLPRAALGDDSLPDPFQDLPTPMKRSLAQLKVLSAEQYGALGPRNFSRDDPPKDRSAGLRRAITIWQLLMDRDVHDPAILEASLAIAYAYDQLQAFAQAHTAYTDAIAKLEAVRQELADSEAQVHSGFLTDAISQDGDRDAMFVALNKIHIAPDETNGALFDALTDYHEIQSLLAALPAADAAADATTSPSASTRSGLEALRIEVSGRIQERAVASLQRQQLAIRKYLEAAYFSAARLEDPSLHPKLTP